MCIELVRLIGELGPMPRQARPFLHAADGSGQALGLCVGANASHRGPFVNEQMTRRAATLVASTIAALGALPPGYQSFAFTSIQCNIDSFSDDHTDSGNCGASAILILGDFGAGGELLIDGTAIQGRSAITFFDGGKRHASNNFRSGSRISLVLFCHSGYFNLGDQDKNILRECGFPLPPPEGASGAGLLSDAERLIDGCAGRRRGREGGESPNRGRVGAGRLSAFGRGPRAAAQSLKGRSHDLRDGEAQTMEQMVRSKLLGLHTEGGPSCC